jgi:Zn-dependent protease
MSQYSQVIQLIALYAIPGIFAITLHEAAHGYAARHFGDPTAALAGRISLNPARHVDPIGTLLIPALILLATGGKYALAGPSRCRWTSAACATPSATCCGWPLPARAPIS